MRWLKVLQGMRPKTEDEGHIYDGGMATLACYMQALRLIPASKPTWYVLSERVTLVKTEEHVTNMFLYCIKARKVSKSIM